MNIPFEARTGVVVDSQELKAGDERKRFDEATMMSSIGDIKVVLKRNEESAKKISGRNTKIILLRFPPSVVWYNRKKKEIHQAVSQEYHDRTKKLDSELHGTQQDQRGPIKNELNEYGHKGRVLAPVIGRYRGASSESASYWTLVPES